MFKPFQILTEMRDSLQKEEYVQQMVGPSNLGKARRPPIIIINIPLEEQND